MAAQYGQGKIANDYSNAISPDLFSACPKAVFAAIAVSPAINNGGNFDREYTADEWIVTEWHALNATGIVPQPVPARFRGLVVESSFLGRS